VDIMSRSTHTGRCFLWKATLQAPAQSGLFVLKAPDSPLTTTGRDLSQRRQPQNSFCYISGAEPNGSSMRPALSSAGERLTNFCKGWPAWRHPERILEMVSTDAEAS
jgi:hypothetical protein